MKVTDMHLWISGTRNASSFGMRDGISMMITSVELLKNPLHQFPRVATIFGTHTAALQTELCFSFFISEAKVVISISLLLGILVSLPELATLHCL